MSTQPVRCQKCGKPVGYITVLSKGLMGMQQKFENLKIVAICMECYQKKLTCLFGKCFSEIPNFIADIMKRFDSGAFLRVPYGLGIKEAFA